MNWEKLTCDEFAAAVEKCGRVCVIPIGVLERHGSHLPLGTDMFTGWQLANAAAEKSEVMVFPQYCFGQIPEATHEPGTLAIDLDLMIKLLDGVCSEIARNGFNRILLFSAHGGNTFWKFFLARQLQSRRDYMCYYYFAMGDAKAAEVMAEVRERTGGWGEHAGGDETAMSLHLFPELVKLDKALPADKCIPLTAHKDHFSGSAVATPIDWYAGHPTHVDGYFGRVTPQDGKKICDAVVDDLVAAIEKIKSDDLSMPLMREFYDRSGK